MSRVNTTHEIFNYFYNGFIGHQSTFIQRDLFHTIGLYDEQLKICSDWQFFMLAIIKHKTNYLYIDVPIAVFRRDGISSKPESIKIIEEEKKKVILYYFTDDLFNNFGKLLTLKTHIKQSRLIKLISFIDILPWLNK